MTMIVRRMTSYDVFQLQYDDGSGPLTFNGPSYLSPGNYTFIVNSTMLNIGSNYELSLSNLLFDNYSFNATDTYEHFEFDIEISKYFCNQDLYLGINSVFGSYYDSYNFTGDCEQVAEFELYHDNGTGPIIGPIIDGWATYLSPGNHTFILNVSHLDIGEYYSLHLNGNIFGGNYDYSWNATDTYEQFEFDIMISEHLCYESATLEINTYRENGDYFYNDNSYYFYGDCEQVAEFELYYNLGYESSQLLPVSNYTAFESCYSDNESWECEVDYNGDGDIDSYYYLYNNSQGCIWDNMSMMYWCEMDSYETVLQPGNYTIYHKYNKHKYWF